MQRAISTLGILGLIAVGLSVQATAEVSVKTDLNGEYVSTVIVPGGTQWNPGVWGGRARTGLRRSTAVLNPTGDLRGDLIPAIEDNTVAPHHPWAVWSRFNGHDYDLVWSTWSGRWTTITPLSRYAMDGDDLQPAIAFARGGRPIVTWWNRDPEDGHGTVYFSVFLAHGWMQPAAISSDEFGGRNPSIRVNSRDRIEISYVSDDGRTQFTQLVQWDRPTTITDDIDPQSFVFMATDAATSKAAYEKY